MEPSKLRSVIYACRMLILMAGSTILHMGSTWPYTRQSYILALLALRTQLQTLTFCDHSAVPDEGLKDARKMCLQQQQPGL